MPTSAPAEFDYRKGTIAVIEVWNFVTYSHMAIFPNSRLNLVIGPNGSGKSSIVCAMCLGLGGHPKLLERGDAAKDYIRHGETEALIQIQLATGNGKEVKLVERKIETDDARESQTDTYAIDGKKAKLKDVKALVGEYNIQLGNYTQFLPQDVVKMFPALTPVQLLQRTQEALGDTTLIKLHEELIQLKQGGGTAEREYEMLDKSLTEEKRKNEILERDVQQFREREILLKRVAAMKQREPSLVFEMKAEMAQPMRDLQKEKKAQFKSMVKELKKREQPLEHEEQKKKQLQEDMKVNQTERRRKTSAHRGMLEKMEEHEETIQEKKEELAGIQNEYEKRVKKLEAMREQRAEFAAELEQLGDDTEALTAQKKALGHAQSECTNERFTAESAVKTADRDVQMKRRQIADLKEELKRVRDVDKGKLHELSGRKQNFRGHFGAGEWLEEAYEWVKINSHRFRGKVYGPVAMHISVPDKKNAAFVETSIPRDYRFAFVTESDEDREIINEKFGKQQNFKAINYVHDPTKAPKCRIPLAQLAPLGVTAYVQDLYDAPELVKLMLASTQNLQNIAVGGDGAEKNKEKIFGTGLSRMLTPQHMYQNDRSVHTGEYNTSIRSMRNDVHVFGNDVDKTAESRIKKEGMQAEHELGELAEALEVAKAALDPIQAKIVEITRQLAEVTNKMKERKALQSKIQIRDKSIEKYEADTVSPEKAGAKIGKEIAKVNATRVKVLQKVLDSMEACRKIIAIHDSQVLQAAVLGSKLAALREHIESYRKEVDEINKEYQAVTERWNTMKEDLKKAKAAMEAVEAMITEETKEMWNAGRDR
jgi:chromosome segregation ATPase